MKIIDSFLEKRIMQMSNDGEPATLPDSNSPNKKSYRGKFSKSPGIFESGMLKKCDKIFSSTDSSSDRENPLPFPADLTVDDLEFFYLDYLRNENEISLSILEEKNVDLHPETCPSIVWDVKKVIFKLFENPGPGIIWNKKGGVRKGTLKKFHRILGGELKGIEAAGSDEENRLKYIDFLFSLSLGADLLLYREEDRRLKISPAISRERFDKISDGSLYWKLVKSWFIWFRGFFQSENRGIWLNFDLEGIDAVKQILENGNRYLEVSEFSLPFLLKTWFINTVIFELETNEAVTLLESGINKAEEQIIREFVLMGILERSSSDQNSVKIRLTETGRRVLEEIFKAHTTALKTITTVNVGRNALVNVIILSTFMPELEQKTRSLYIFKRLQKLFCELEDLRDELFMDFIDLTASSKTGKINKKALELTRAVMDNLSAFKKKAEFEKHLSKFLKSFHPGDASKV